MASLLASFVVPLPVVFPLASEVMATGSGRQVGSPYSPDHVTPVFVEMVCGLGNQEESERVRLVQLVGHLESVGFGAR